MNKIRNKKNKGKPLLTHNGIKSQNILHRLLIQVITLSTTLPLALLLPR